MLLAQPLFRFPMRMIFQLIMKLLTDKASLTCAVLLVTLLSGLVVLPSILGFCSFLFSLFLGMFIVVDLLRSGIGQKRSERVDRG